MKQFAAHIVEQSEALKEMVDRNPLATAMLESAYNSEREFRDLQSEWSRDPSEFGYFESGDYQY
jgi:hypothetical protein